MRIVAFTCAALACAIAATAAASPASVYITRTVTQPTTKGPAEYFTGTVAIASQPATVELEQSQMWMTVGERRFAITLADTAAAHAFAAMLPLTIDMADLNSNEKHAELPRSLPMNASRPGTIRNGDLMLYGSRTLVIFYVTFDSSYSYTRLGRVDDPSGLVQALGRREVQIAFTKSEMRNP